MKKISIKIITLFPDFIEAYAGFGIIARAMNSRILKLQVINLRKFGVTARKTVDDRPYGGGVGMVLRPDVVISAIFHTVAKNLTNKSKTTRVILLSPQGRPFDQAMAKRLTKYNELILVAGRYEGFDERVRKFVDEEISIGDYILMGGELPALVITEAVLRNVPGVLGKDESVEHESFSDNLLEYPQYTKPEVLIVKKLQKKNKKMRVPKILLSGHHEKVFKWRQDEAIKRTKKRRPDLAK